MTKFSIITIAVFLILGLLGGYAAAEKKYSTPTYSVTLFSTLVSRDKNSDVSSREQASTYFGESIIGWTLSPNFTDSLGFGVGARKQERQNIVFQFSSVSEAEGKNRAKIFQEKISEKLEKYNTQSQSDFLLMIDTPSISENNPKKIFWVIGGGILGLFFGLLGSEIFGFLRRKNFIPHPINNIEK